MPVVAQVATAMPGAAAQAAWASAGVAARAAARAARASVAVAARAVGWVVWAAAQATRASAGVAARAVALAVRALAAAALASVGVAARAARAARAAARARECGRGARAAWAAGVGGGGVGGTGVGGGGVRRRGRGGASGTAGGDAGNPDADAGACPPQPPVVLGAADGFAVLAGSTVTNTGLTMVTGDLGTSPGTAVTGFGPGVVVGTQHAGDGVSAAAEAALTTAYNDAAGRSLCAILVAGNLGGMTLTPGLYKSSSTLEISSGDLVLDARGDSSAVFIFQTATMLSTTSGRQVTLIGGALAANVFWQVGTSATLGTTTVFVGTIMADQAISLATGATLNGRALARIAAVTLDTNVIVKP